MVFKNKIKDIFVFIILIGLLCIATFKDFYISDSFHSSNSWINQFFAIIAKIPFYFIASFSCALLFKLSLNKENKTQKIFLIFLYSLGGIICAMLSIEDIVEIILSGIFKIIVMFLLSLAIYAYFVYIAKGIDKENILSVKKELLIILISAGIIVVICFSLKQFVDRARFNDVILKHGSFTNWYEIGTGGDSFPSGHTASAFALIAVIPLIKKLNTQNKGIIYLQKNDYILYVIVFTYSMFVAMTRINSGMHYLSDVTMALLISFLVSKIVTWCVLGFNEDKFEIKSGSLIDKL